MTLTDTHCHLHSLEFFTNEQAETAYTAAINNGVTRLLCVATSLKDSEAAIAFAHAHPEHVWATIGIHPHEAAKLSLEEIKGQLTHLQALAIDSKVVGVGECGFDFYYNDPTECLEAQTLLLKGQLAIAQEYDLPVSFHVREAFQDFWPVFESFPGVRGVLHSFTDRPQHTEKALAHGLYFGINGIATFTTHAWQIEQFKTLPLDRIVLETDAPFLTPKPKRGTMNSPENVIYITNFLAELRGETEEQIAELTSANAKRLFRLS